MGEAIKGLIFGTIMAGLTLWAILAWGPIIIPAFAEFAANHPVFVWIVIGGLVIYFLPSIIAVKAERKNALAIVALNVFLGWTFLGWLASLIWALAGERQQDEKPQPVVADLTPPPAQAADDIVGKLAKAAQMKADGHLSDDEYKTLKAKLLGAVNAG